MKRLLWLLLLLAPPAFGNGSASGFCEIGNRSVVTSGLTSTTKVQQSFPVCTVTVFNNGTVTPATIYSNNANPPTAIPGGSFTANVNGYWQFYAANGSYDIVLSGAGFPAPFTMTAVNVGAGSGLGVNCAIMPGANYGVKFTNAVANLPTTGGIIDCSDLQGPQTNASDAWTGVTKPITLTAPVGVWTLGSNVSIPSTMTVIMPHGASIVKNGFTLTILGSVIDLNGTNAPIEFGGGFSPYGSLIHVGPYGTSGGGYLTSEAVNNFSLSSGAKFDGTNWTATATDAGQVHISGQIIEFFENTGLTVGNTYTPTVRMFIQGSNEILGGTIAVGSNTGSTNVSSTGDVKVRNNTTALAARNAAGTADIALVQTDTNNDLYYGNGNARDIYLTPGAGRGVYITGALVSIGSISAASGAIRVNNNTGLVGRNFLNTADIGLVQSDTNNDLFYGNSNARDIYLTTGNGRTVFMGSSAALSLGSTTAASGTLRLPYAFSIKNRNSVDGADYIFAQVLTHTEAGINTIQIGTSGNVSPLVLYGSEVAADVAAPSTNVGACYFRDNGGGKTQLVCRFPTGAIQVVATEP